jgi:ABC-2 type transport system permease protein
MGKIGLIIKREYLTRVRKKSFIIMTILGPLLFACLLIVPIWLTSMDGEEKVIEVLDESGYFREEFSKVGGLHFEFIDESVLDAKQRVPQSHKYGLLYIPPFDIDQPSGIVFFSEKHPSMDVLFSIENVIQSRVENLKLKRSGLDKETLESLKTRVKVQTINLSEEGEKEGHAVVASAVGYIFSFMIYIFIFVYGAQVMRGVIEEKSNKIIEVVISSVKPFQLMMGKILGVAGVVLTQFVLWILLTSMISGFLGAGLQTPAQTVALSSGSMASAGLPEADMQAHGEWDQFWSALLGFDFGLIILSFGFYFIGGYLLYAALFAAVGSAIDNDSDSQQFVVPITIPLMLSIIVLSAVIKDPDSPLAFWMSIIPFTSPVVMMMRVPFGVPVWELVLSMILLTLGFIFTTWMASRVYRIGILMTGSKVNYKTLWKWLKMNN